MLHPYTVTLSVKLHVNVRVASQEVENIGLQEVVSLSKRGMPMRACIRIDPHRGLSLLLGILYFSCSPVLCVSSNLEKAIVLLFDSHCHWQSAISPTPPPHAIRQAQLLNPWKPSEA